MTDEQRTKIIGYARVISNAIPAAPTGEAAEDPLLTFVVDDVAERVMLYLNREDLPDNILRVLARVVVSGFNQATAGMDQTVPEQAVKSLSDNGQSITYSDNVTQYFASADDSAIFGSFTHLLDPYRRIKVVSQ